MASRRPRTLLRPVVLALAAALVLGGCGTGSEPSPPTGIDELVVPTPAPRVEDFVGRVRAPFLPATWGSRWAFDDGTVITADRGPRRRGIETTALATILPGGDRTLEFVAQDRGGRVWLLGVKDAGAASPTWFDAAGLVLPPAPRRADGFVRRPAAAGEEPVVARVLATDVDEDTPAGRFDDVVLVEVGTEGTGRVLGYARGTGPVLLGSARLVEHDAG